MKRLLRWIGIAAGVFLVALASIGALGASQPVSHEVSKSETFPLSATRLWELSLALFHRTNDGAYAIVEENPPHRFVTAIVDRSLPYGGTWTYEFAPSAAGTRLTITERGDVYNPFFRFVARFVMGSERSIHDYFAALHDAMHHDGSAES
jgi:hypothetical protein